jgi:hypothetical protein
VPRCNVSCRLAGTFAASPGRGGTGHHGELSGECIHRAYIVRWVRLLLALHAPVGEGGLVSATLNPHVLSDTGTWILGVPVRRVSLRFAQCR